MAKVIVVHTNIQERARISQGLQQLGWTVFPAASGREAFRALAFFTPDLLLYSAEVTDVPAEHVPGLLSGHPALRRLGFVVLHAPDDAEVFFLAQQAGADRLVSEDIPSAGLAAVLIDVVETRRRTAAAADTFDPAF